METEQILVSVSDAAVAEPTAGKLLQEERKRQGLSEKAIADRLHMTMYYVRAVESDSYDKLPGAVYAKGYIRNYALTLGLDAEKLISVYLGQAKTPSPPQVVNSRIKVTNKSSDSNLLWLLHCVFALAIGFASLWAYRNYFTEIELPGAELENRKSAENIQLSDTLSARPFTETGNSRVATTPISAAEDPADQAEIEIEQDSDTQPNESSNRLIEIVSTGEDVLEISFTGESWIEIGDSGIASVFRDIRVAGDVVRITGVAPFKILLGNAPFASLQLNGIEIDVSDSIRIDNSARLTVGI